MELEDFSDDEKLAREERIVKLTGQNSVSTALRARRAEPVGVTIGESAKQCLRLSAAPADQPHGWTLQQAVAMIQHLGPLHTKAELIEALAYMTCQFWGMERESNRDAVLAMAQVKHAVEEYERTRNR